ncbi:MAG: DNA polymerase III subunit gamma/tau [Synergistetes bacterium]|nr:DNA polymerase III subunit gamma/tau [Synergistota bacterium]
MAYLALYRKWRPQKFSEVVGQEVVVKILQNAIKTNRIAHAYLFAGPRGVGKTSVARIFAKALNCENGPGIEPCNLCFSCKKITEGSSFDVLEIDGASNRGVEEVRALKERISLAPIEGRYKVYIIDEVHMLTVEAFNALLKTLEEPPSRVIFILATTEPHKLPLTIRSRCIFLAFKSLDPKCMVGRLKEILDSEGIKVPFEVLLEISRRADGSMRDSISFLEQLLTLGEEITFNSLEKNFGILSRSEVREKIPLFREGRWMEIFEWVRSLKDRGVMIPYLFEDFSEIFRKVWLFKIFPQADVVFDISSDEREFYLLESRYWDEEVLWSILNVIEKRGDRIRMGSSPFREFEMFLWDLRRKIASGSKVVMESSSFKDEVKKEELKRPVEAEVKSQAIGEDNKKWEEFLKKLKEKKISLYAFLMDANNSLSNGKLRVEYPADLRFHYEQLKRAENIVFLKEALKEVFGEEIELEIVISNAEGEVQEKVLESIREEKPRSVLEHPTFQTILKLFGGDVVEVERESGEEDERS